MFHDSFIDKLLSYIDNRKSKFSSLSSISSNISSSSNISFEFDTNLASQISLQRTLICAFLSIRLHTVIHTQQAYIHTTNKHFISSSFNNNNMIESYNNNNNNDIDDFQDDYYNIEAKKRRKRRRSIIQNNNNHNNYSHSNISSYQQILPSLSNNQHLYDTYNNPNINYTNNQIPLQTITNINYQSTNRGFPGSNY